MSKDAPYTLTIYVAAPGTPLRSGGTSMAGHMYLSVHHDGETRSYGFAPIEHGASSGPGEVSGADERNYIKPYYARTMEITRDQYEKIQAYGREPEKYGFDKEYSGLGNSCIDFTWGALNHANLHRQTRGNDDKTFEGAVRPLSNEADIKSIPAPFPNSKLNQETRNEMPSRTLKQWLISENDSPQGRGEAGAVALRPSDQGHPDNALLGQIRGKVAELDTANGRSFDQTSEQLSASLLVLAKDNGLTRVDSVLLSERTAHAPAAHNVFIVQGDRGDPAHLRAAMPTALAAQAPVEASFERVEQLSQAQRQTAASPELARENLIQAQEQEAIGRRMG